MKEILPGIFPLIDVDKSEFIINLITMLLMYAD